MPNFGKSWTASRWPSTSGQFRHDGVKGATQTSPEKLTMRPSEWHCEFLLAKRRALLHQVNMIIHRGTWLSLTAPLGVKTRDLSKCTSSQPSENRRLKEQSCDRPCRASLQDAACPAQTVLEEAVPDDSCLEHITFLTGG